MPTDRNKTFNGLRIDRDSQIDPPPKKKKKDGENSEEASSDEDVSNALIQKQSDITLSVYDSINQSKKKF